MTYPPLWLEGLPFELKRVLLPIITRNLRIVSSGVRPSLRWLPVWESVSQRPTPFTVRSSKKLGQMSDLVKTKPTFSFSAKALPLRHRSWYINPVITLKSRDTSTITGSCEEPRWQGYSRLGDPAFTPRLLRSLSKPDRAHICTISGMCNNKSSSNQVNNRQTTLPTFFSMTSGREVTLPPEAEERAVEFEDAPNMDRSREERDTEVKRPSERRTKDNRHQGMNLPPLLASYMRRNENSQPLQSSLTSIHGGHRSSTNAGCNLPPDDAHISHNAQPFVPNTLQPSNGFIPIYVNPYSQLNMGIAYG
ncbi:hypothetical protein Tco_0331665 [Tanacetum coccineum]